MPMFDQISHTCAVDKFPAHGPIGWSSGLVNVVPISFIYAEVIFSKRHIGCQVSTVVLRRFPTWTTINNPPATGLPCCLPNITYPNIIWSASPLTHISMFVSCVTLHRVVPVRTVPVGALLRPHSGNICINIVQYLIRFGTGKKWFK